MYADCDIDCKCQKFSSPWSYQPVSHIPPDLCVNPTRIQQRCDAPVLFLQQLLFVSAWFSSLWCWDKESVGGERHLSELSQFLFIHFTYWPFKADAFTQAHLLLSGKKVEWAFIYEIMNSKRTLMKCARDEVTEQWKHISVEDGKASGNESLEKCSE